MRRHPALPTTILTLVMLALAVSCGGSGRTLREPDPVQRQNAPPRRTSSTLASTTTLTGLHLSSSLLPDGGRLPNDFSCSGAGISPPLTWTGVPNDAKSLALFVTDTDAEGAVQWLVVNIPPSTGSITKGTAPTGGMQLPNSFGSAGWKAPCADTTHTYEFYIAAFTDPPNVEGMDPKQAVSTLQTTASSTSVIRSTFAKASPGTT
jgi:Raf kinase inhibitor-like YbhB/YbcL family protein